MKWKSKCNYCETKDESHKVWITDPYKGRKTICLKCLKEKLDGLENEDK